jgi:putative ABC transport system permease protein
MSSFGLPWARPRGDSPTFRILARHSLLYGVRANDPLILAAVIAFLALVTATACLVPAVRATRMNPVTALR